MKKMALVLLAVFFSFTLCLPAASAASVEPEGTPLRKLQRGFLNAALSPLEIARALSEEKKTDSVIPTWATALGRGSVFAVGRVLAGAYEIVTFPLPLPSGYQPIVYPEFGWEHFETPEETL